MTHTIPRGLSVAVITPMNEDGTLDLAGLTRHVKWLVDEGVDILMPCGTTGESATLDADEQRRVIATCVAAAEGRVPVFAGAGSNSTARSVGLAYGAREEGAAGLLVVTPYYNRPSQEGMIRYFMDVADVGQGLPVILYNVPNRTGVNLKPDTVFRLAELEPFVGLKEASGDLEQLMTLIRGRPEGFLVLSGDDAMTLPFMALGGDGLVSVAANQAPGRMKAFVAAALAGEMTRARAAHYELLPLMRVNFLETNPVPVKTSLHLMDRIEDPHVRGPLAPLTEESLETLKRVLLEVGVLESAR